MKSSHKKIQISIYLHKIGFIKAGILNIYSEKNYSEFVYDIDYMHKNYPPLNPATLNWRINNQQKFVTSLEDNKHMLDTTFSEMIPNQNDWGNQVLVAQHPEYHRMNNAEKLYFLGNRISGGLKAERTEEAVEQNITTIDYLDKIRDESISFYLNQIDKITYHGVIKQLTSYGGVRPKCMYEENGEFWIVKFNSPDDIYDMACNEQIAMDMAKDSGLNTAFSKVVKMPSGENVFFSKRFDRENNDRFHSLSLFSLVPGNEKFKQKSEFSNNNAGFIQTLIRRYSDFENIDTVNIVTKMLLDIGLNNTDNHLRNLRIILNKNYKWELSPVYDINFNPYNQEHIYNPANLALHDLYLNNKNIIHSLHKELGVDKDIIEDKLIKVKGVLNNWEQYCDKYNISEHDKEQIGKAVNLGLNRSEYTISKKQKHKNTIPLPKLKPY